VHGVCNRRGSATGRHVVVPWGIGTLIPGAAVDWYPDTYSADQVSQRSLHKDPARHQSHRPNPGRQCGITHIQTSGVAEVQKGRVYLMYCLLRTCPSKSARREHPCLAFVHLNQHRQRSCMAEGNGLSGILRVDNSPGVCHQEGLRCDHHLRCPQPSRTCTTAASVHAAYDDVLPPLFKGAPR
jgi:hypothetical protein